MDETLVEKDQEIAQLKGEITHLRRSSPSETLEVPQVGVEHRPM